MYRDEVSKRIPTKFLIVCGFLRALHPSLRLCIFPRPLRALYHVP